MGKRKKKRGPGARVVWSLVLGYLILGGIVAVLFLQQIAAGADPAPAGGPSLNNAWGLFPLIVLLWPIFLVVMILKAIF